MSDVILAEKKVKVFQKEPVGPDSLDCSVKEQSEELNLSTTASEWQKLCNKKTSVRTKYSGKVMGTVWGALRIMAQIPTFLPFSFILLIIIRHFVNVVTFINKYINYPNTFLLKEPVFPNFQWNHHRFPVLWPVVEFQYHLFKHSVFLNHKCCLCSLLANKL